MAIQVLRSVAEVRRWRAQLDARDTGRSLALVPTMGFLHEGHVALLHVGWPSSPLPVRWRDLSLTGLSLYAPQPLAVGQRLRLVDSALEGVAEVVGCRPQGRLHVVHARLLTALPTWAMPVRCSAAAVAPPMRRQAFRR